MITFSLAYTKKVQLCTKQLGTCISQMYGSMSDSMQRLRDYGLEDISKLLLKI